MLAGGGAKIPLDQILAGPLRARLAFAEASESETRTLLQMLEGDALAVGTPPRHGVKAGRHAGWGPLARGAAMAHQTVVNGAVARQLTIGLILVNDRVHQQVTLQPRRREWSGVRVVHKPLYQ